MCYNVIMYNHLTIVKLSKNLPPSGKVSHMSRHKRKALLKHAFSMIPLSETHTEMSNIPTRTLSRYRINPTKQSHVFKILYKRDIGYLIDWFEKEMFDKYIKNTNIWQTRIIKHHFDDIKQRFKLEDSNTIAFNSMLNYHQAKGTQFNVVKMTYNQFETLFVNYTLFKKLVIFTNKSTLTRSRSLFGWLSKKRYEGKRGEKYYNV